MDMNFCCNCILVISILSYSLCPTNYGFFFFAFVFQKYTTLFFSFKLISTQLIMQSVAIKIAARYFKETQGLTLQQEVAPSFNREKH